MHEQDIEPGIYFDLPEQTYHSARGLSCSGMKHLTVSDLNYWHRNLSSLAEPEEDNAARRFGKAVHCYALERERFDASFAMKLTEEDRPGTLVTTDDIKKFLAANGLPKTAKNKSELIERVLASGFPAVIWEHELAAYEAMHEGKSFLMPMNRSG